MRTVCQYCGKWYTSNARKPHSCPQKNAVLASRSSQPLPSLNELVRRFLKDHLPGLMRQRDHYRQMESLAEAIHNAALARDLYGHKEPHQWRIRADVLQRAHDVLLQHEAEFASTKSFSELHEKIAARARHIEGFGKLCLYDVAARIGWTLGPSYAPEVVYLHAGTEKGAAHFGVKGRARAATSAFPPPVCEMAPEDVEAFLCIFEDDLAALAASNALPREREPTPRPSVMPWGWKD